MTDTQREHLRIAAHLIDVLTELDDNGAGLHEQDERLISTLAAVVYHVNTAKPEAQMPDVIN